MTELDKDALDAAASAIAGGGSLRDAIRAYLDAADDWRPMESAPKDGTEILAAIEVHIIADIERWEQRVIGFDADRGEIGLDYDDGWRWEDYTHWRPLPSPPKEGE